MNESINRADAVLGAQVIGYSLQAIYTLLAVAAAWACSGFWFTLIMGIIAMLLAAVAYKVSAMVLDVAVSIETKASIGHAVGGAAAKVTGWFSRVTAPKAA